MQITLKLCLRFAPTLSGCMNGWPFSLCSTAFASGTTSPSMSVVRKTFAPQTIGCEWPRPSIGVFHLMFLSTFHSVGTLVSDETPAPSGPRHCDQFEPGAALVENVLNTANAIRHKAKAENSGIDTRLISQ